MTNIIERRSAHIAIVGLVAVGSFALSSIALAGPDDADFIRPDGSVDMSKAPDCLPVAGPDGEPLLRPDGSPVLVPFVPPGDDLPMEALQGVESPKEFAEALTRANPRAAEQIEQRQNPAFEREFLIAAGRRMCYSD